MHHAMHDARKQPLFRRWQLGGLTRHHDVQAVAKTELL